MWVGSAANSRCCDGATSTGAIETLAPLGGRIRPSAATARPIVFFGYDKLGPFKMDADGSRPGAAEPAAGPAAGS